MSKWHCEYKRFSQLGPLELGARDLLRDYFLSNLGVVLDSEALRKASGGISEWARRVRELRNEEGYQILTHNDRSELKPGQYVLFTAKPEPAFERGISKETRAIVLDRNGFTCQMCGAGAGEPHPFDPSRKVRLHLGHTIDKSMGGTDDASRVPKVSATGHDPVALTFGTRGITVTGAITPK
jgi:hypothetical protein